MFIKTFIAHALFEISREGKGDDVLMSIESFANYVAMVNPAKGSDFLAQVKRIKKLYGKIQR